MLIPSIDLMGGKIVQLIQGERKALEFDNFDDWIERFSKYPITQLIDLDAAMGSGDNHELVKYFAERLPCQAGGGIRSVDKARETLALGAKKVIIGSALVQNGEIDSSFAKNLASQISLDSLIFAIDSKSGTVATHGWRSRTRFTAIDMIRALDCFCGAFLYTHIDSEGLMAGFPIAVIREIRAATSRGLIAAGGITTEDEIAQLEAIHVDCVVGMAIYTDKLKLASS